MNTIALVSFAIAVLAALVSLHFTLVARIHGKYAEKFRELGQAKDADR